LFLATEKLVELAKAGIQQCSEKLRIPAGACPSMIKAEAGMTAQESKNSFSTNR
jgi:hypothetical protein